jgi:hypothetical protein
MPSSGILCCVALVRTDVSEERSASIIRVTRIGELGTTLAVISNRHTPQDSHVVFLCSMRWLLVTANVVPSSQILVTLMMEVMRSSDTSVLTRVTRHNIPEDGILHNIQCFISCIKPFSNLQNTFCSYRKEGEMLISFPFMCISPHPFSYMYYQL